MTYTDHKYLREKDLHFMLKWACNPMLRGITSSPWEQQLIGAMTTPAYVQRGGVIKDHGWVRMLMFRHLYRMERDTRALAQEEMQTNSAAFQLRSAPILPDAANVVMALFAKRLARSLAVPVENIDTRTPPHVFRVDSLVSVELPHRFTTQIRADISVMQILGNASISELGRMSAEASEQFLNRDQM
ncbi:hypothetical protein RRF57_007891 [Xylaria bambusicola]|uniref:Carrier domain-containing protein n=1 Tax=Xylaria bambusicola TaxID=326684 RepID=A0AAN7Z6M6_9PEZI